MIATFFLGLTACTPARSPQALVADLRSADDDVRSSAVWALDGERLPRELVAPLVEAYEKEPNRVLQDGLLYALAKSGQPEAKPAMDRALSPRDRDAYERAWRTVEPWMRKNPEIAADMGIPLSPEAVHVSREAEVVSGCAFRGTTQAKIRNVDAISSDAFRLGGNAVKVTPEAGRYLAEIYRCPRKPAPGAEASVRPAAEAAIPSAAPAATTAPPPHPPSKRYGSRQGVASAARSSSTTSRA